MEWHQSQAYNEDLFFLNISSLSSILLPAGYNVNLLKKSLIKKKCTEDYTNNSVYIGSCHENYASAERMCSFTVRW